MKDKIKVGWEKIKTFWVTNRDEIIESVMSTKQNEMQDKKKKEEIEEFQKRERKAIKLPLIMGLVYILAGIILLWYYGRHSSFVNEPQNTIIGLELIVVGIYALLYVIIFYSERGNWKKHWLLKVVRGFVLFLMLPYHIGIKLIKSFLKDTRQEHVSQFFPYYLISLFIVMFTYIFMIKLIAGWKIDDAYNWVAGFMVVFVLLKEFFWCGKFFAYLSTKSVIKSVQKAKIKKMSKVNWRGIMNDELHKQERRDKFEEEWVVVKEELEYTEIYFYIILTVLVLWIPKESGSLSELLSNQFFGITTIAALAREAISKKE